MKKIFLILILIIAAAGCDTSQRKDPIEDHQYLNDVYTDYAPARITLLPLSEVHGSDRFFAYVKLADNTGSDVKWPGVFRFELYQRNVRTAEPKGKRLILWPDIDITGVQANNRYWQAALGCYKFELNLNSESIYGNILQITFTRPDSKRIMLDIVPGR